MEWLKRTSVKLNSGTTESEFYEHLERASSRGKATAIEDYTEYVESYARYLGVTYLEISTFLDNQYGIGVQSFITKVNEMEKEQ